MFGSAPLILQSANNITIMSERRTLTIGVVINLGNHESLRLEVSDCVQTEEDAAKLAEYMNHVLNGYGQNDAATRASIDKYRARVMGQYASEVFASSSFNPSDELLCPVSAFDGIVKEEVRNPPEPVIIEEEPRTQEPIIAEPELVKVEKKSVPMAEDLAIYTCEKCGTAVSRVQRDVSNLFMGKTFCKSCMK
jgi:hypothetical protein